MGRGTAACGRHAHARSLHIEFTGREEFLERLGAVVFGLENDTERMLAFVAGVITIRVGMLTGMAISDLDADLRGMPEYAAGLHVLVDATAILGIEATGEDRYQLGVTTRAGSPLP